MKNLNELEIAEELAKLKTGWKTEDGSLYKEFKFDDFKDSVEFFNKTFDIAEKLDHHPEMNIARNKAAIKIMTHETNGITDLDFELAGRIDELA